MLINIHTHIVTNPFKELLNSSSILDDGYFSYCEDLESIGLIQKKSEAEIESILTHENCLALGETGLDKNLSISFNKQIEYFINQIHKSEKYQLPIIIHCVKSWNELSKIKNEFSVKQPWVFHGFRKTNLIESILASNVKISIGTAVLWDKRLQECVKEIPINQLFLETDNDLRFTIRDVYNQVSRIKNISLQTLEEQLYINTKNTFIKWEIGLKEQN